MASSMQLGELYAAGKETVGKQVDTIVGAVPDLDEIQTMAMAKIKDIKHDWEDVSTGFKQVKDLVVEEAKSQIDTLEAYFKEQLLQIAHAAEKKLDAAVDTIVSNVMGALKELDEVAQPKSIEDLPDTLRRITRLIKKKKKLYHAGNLKFDRYEWNELTEEEQKLWGADCLGYNECNFDASDGQFKSVACRSGDDQSGNDPPASEGMSWEAMGKETSYMYTDATGEPSLEAGSMQKCAAILGFSKDNWDINEGSRVTLGEILKLQAWRKILSFVNVSRARDSWFFFLSSSLLRNGRLSC